jgi:hypothetical protein
MALFGWAVQKNNNPLWAVAVITIDIKSIQNRAYLKVCFVPATSGSLQSLLFVVAINSTNEANKAGSTHR